MEFSSKILRISTVFQLDRNIILVLPKYMFWFFQRVGQLDQSLVLYISSDFMGAEYQCSSGSQSYTHHTTVLEPCCWGNLAIGGIGLQCTLHGTRKTYPTKLTGSKFGTSSTQKGLQMGGYVIVPRRVHTAQHPIFLFAPSASEIRFEAGTMLKKSVNLKELRWTEATKMLVLLGKAFKIKLFAVW